MYFEHWKYVTKNDWHWPNFRPREIASNGDQSLLINFDAMNKLQYARNLINKPIIINSGYRDELYNATVGGSPRSYHLEGRAFDISLFNQNKHELVNILKEVGFTGFGISYNSFVHVDNGYPRSW